MKQFIIALCLLIPVWAGATDVKFSWLPNSEENLAGYKIHEGTAVGQYTSTTDVGLPETNAEGRVEGTITGIPDDGVPRYFAATAYNDKQESSDYSDEVVYNPGGAVLMPAAPVSFDASPQALFSWLESQEPEVFKYSIYCDKSPAADIATHELWKSVTEYDVHLGRVNYQWTEFPADTYYYCVVVAIGQYGDETRSSGFSNEVHFKWQKPEVVIPATPQDFLLIQIIEVE